MSIPERWTLVHDGVEHAVSIVATATSRTVTWTVDDTEVTARTSLDGTLILDGEDHGAVRVRSSALGRTRRVTWWSSDARAGAVATAAAGLGGTDLDPEPGSRAAEREAWIRAHPTAYALRRTAVATVKVAVPVLLAWLLARVALPAIPWPDWSLPAIPWPDIRLPRIPWPDIPWPDISWPAIPWPAIPWPSWSLPAWLEPVRRAAPFVVPVLVAALLARGEVRRRRAQDELKRSRPKVPYAGRMDWDDVDAALLDLDGVITPTAEVHMRAWEVMFTRFLDSLPEEHEPYTDADYFAHVDGRPRYEGVATFLDSRGIELPHGDPSDSPDELTVCGLGNRKNELFNEVLEQEGIEAYPGSVRLLDALPRRGVAMAVVSSSKNAVEVLRTAGLADRFEVVVDGVVAAEHGLAGKPEPDTFRYAAEQLGKDPARCVVLEDAVSGVAAGAAGGFARVIGVDRGVGAQTLRDHGADEVVTDLAELL